MTKIQEIFAHGWDDYCASYSPSPVQRKAAESIMSCKTGKLGYSISICEECGSIIVHNNSCRKLSFSESCRKLRNSYEWNELRDSLYRKDWCPDIRETFNGYGNAIDYLGRYAHRIAITNARIKEVTDDSVTFTAKDYRHGSVKKEVTISCKEFIRRFMMHVLPSGFQKIRYCGFLCNRKKKENLETISRLQGHRRFQSKLQGLHMDEKLMKLWGVDIHICPVCGCRGLRLAGRVYPLRD